MTTGIQLLNTTDAPSCVVLTFSGRKAVTKKNRQNVFFFLLLILITVEIYRVAAVVLLQARKCVLEGRVF